MGQATPKEIITSFFVRIGKKMLKRRLKKLRDFKTRQKIAEMSIIENRNITRVFLQSPFFLFDLFFV